MLPELGVTEKKTHSSSSMSPVAELVRKRVAGGDGTARFDVRHAAVAVDRSSDHRKKQPRITPSIRRRTSRARRVRPVPAAADGTSAPSRSREPAHADARRACASEARASAASAGGWRQRALHPPLRTDSGTGAAGAAAMPSPRPGQILSGPRQPLPAAHSGAPPAPPPVAATPGAPVARTRGRQTSIDRAAALRPRQLPLRTPPRPASGRTARHSSRSASAARHGGTAAADAAVRRPARLSPRRHGPACRPAVPRRFPASRFIAAPFVPASR